MDVPTSVTIISSTMVRPSDETPIKSLWLSRLDMMPCPPNAHALALFVFQPNETQNTQPSPLSTPFFDTDTLKKSLEKALVSCYTMAGRLKVNESNGRYEIDCNVEGVLFSEAKTLSNVADLGGRIDPNSELIKGLFTPYDYSKELSSMPLLMVQLTRFNCGGVCLGISFHHYVVDGSSLALFMNTWARLTNGLDVEVMPDHDRFKYLAPRDPPQFDELPASNYIEPSLPPSELHGKEAVVTNNFSVLEDKINVLKQEAMSSLELSSSHLVTTFSVLAGHTWRCASKARNLPHDQDVMLYIPVNGRSILENPKIPPGYVGNLVVYASCQAKAGDVVHKPLAYTVSKISEAVTKMKDHEHFRSAIDYIETRPSLEPLVRCENNFVCPNFRINYWTKMPFYEVDFGWGTPNLLGPARILSDGQVGFKPTPNDGITVIISLYSIHMAAFEKYFNESS